MLSLLVLVSSILAGGEAEKPPQSERDALKPLNPLVAGWKVTGSTAGTDKTFWNARVDVQWQFKDGVRLEFNFEDSKHFTKWVIDYIPKTKSYRLLATTPAKDVLQYSATLSQNRSKLPTITAERTLPDSTTIERLVITQLHDNRFLYRVETKSKKAISYTRKYQAGATKEGESFANVPKGPVCIVSGGDAKIAVTYKGKTYYVCCTGCRDAFNDHPQKFIDEFAAKQKK